MQISAVSIAFLTLVVIALIAETQALNSHLTKKIGCEDKHHKCGSNTKICKHRTYRLMMIHLCATSCSLCSEHVALKAQCQDKLTNCKKDLCRNKDYKKMMNKLCRATCERC